MSAGLAGPWGSAVWQLSLTGDARVEPVGRGRRGRAASARRLSGLRRGTPVVLLDPRPGGRHRCQEIARRSGVSIEREYLAVPRLASALLLVEDAAEPIRFAWRAVVAPPPGAARLHALSTAAIAAARACLPPSVLGQVVPGRVVVGVRT